METPMNRYKDKIKVICIRSTKKNIVVFFKNYRISGFVDGWLVGWGGCVCGLRCE
jgi:hypothetical protein